MVLDIKLHAYQSCTKKIYEKIPDKQDNNLISLKSVQNHYFSFFFYLLCSSEGGLLREIVNRLRNCKTNQEKTKKRKISPRGCFLSSNLQQNFLRTIY